MLAVRMIQQQGIHVEGINFYTGFCIEGHTQAIRKRDQQKQKRNNALWVAEQLGIKLHIVDISADYKDVVLNPRHGYGQNLNPCLDCKGFMVGQAREWMEANGFDFIITGEVIGQRPMSQRRSVLPVVAEESGAGDRLLRPLCARNLPETLPEREGWVAREELGAITGRSRKEQMRLARAYGFSDYATPAGGCCFLTDEAYSRKLQDLWTARGRRDYELDDIMLLKVGRHLRPVPEFKLIVGREEGENRFLRGYRHRFTQLETTSHPGPLSLVDGELTVETRILAARIAARYSQGRGAGQVEVAITPVGGEPETVTVQPLAADEIPAEWLL